MTCKMKDLYYIRNKANQSQYTKRKLSWLEKIANEVDDSLVFGAVVRVGREHSLYDFKAVASQKVEQELIPQLEKEIKRIADSIVFIEPLAEESGLEEEINLKKLEMENWKKETVVFLTK